MEREMEDIEPQSAGRGHESQAIFERVNHAVTLKFEDVVYTIKVKNEWLLKKKKIESDEKIILKGISGIVFPGEILAMLGPSGSGKTTLLTAMGGRLGGSLSGSISYNGKPFSNVVKRTTGFVTQDDILYPHLTVIETLVYTALLRLPSTLSKEEKVMHAEAVITQLGLTNCKSSIIGSHLVRGVSGGERKRVSIGQEMLINPSLLLLDEPTSGLDSTTAQRIVSTLWELANGGRTIVMTIHQPSSRLFYMFHKVLLLSEGNPIYFGKGADAMDYFSGIGFAPLFSMNPADFLLDLANGVSADDSRDDQALIKQTLVSAFETNLAKNLEVNLQQPNGNLHNDSDAKQYSQWTTTWWQQFSVLFSRGLKERKHEAFSGLKIGQVLAVAILSGLLWWQSDTSHLQDQIGLFFFYTGFWGFFPLFNALFTFPQERLMLEKERASGMYRLSSYFMARTVGDLPMELVLPSVFVIITYWMTGLKPTAAGFFGCLLVVLYSVLVAQGLGLALGAVVMDLKAASTLASVIMLTFLLAGGYYVQHVPSFIAWIKYLSIGQYTYKLLIISQFNPGETYPCPTNGTCLIEDFPPIKNVGLHGLAISLVAMAIMLVGYRLVAYIALVRIGVTRK
ncbi:hypothetical protein ACH5RR_028039 [Cinchona calisaya]|uniref:ABC transporter domain-containing protein n=1 Tax=Cinchona calisaya TaxID=153742 RepID=A0ABD2YSX7_9GENT